MFITYLRYLILFALLVAFACFVEFYIIMEPMPIYPQYAVVPAILVLLLAFFPAKELSVMRENMAMRREAIRNIDRIKESSYSSMQKYSQLRVDGLTGALTKEAFNEIIGLKIMEARHVAVPLSIIIFDIDHFKKINDTYGHSIGDAVLKELSERIRNNLRESEYFIRWGGEEFVVLMPGTSLQGAKMAAEKLRRIVESAPFPEVGRVTCSFGVTALKEDDTIKSFFERADAALYEAKKGGRNRVEVKL